MANGQKRLLIMDDESSFCAFVEKAAARVGFDTTSLTDPAEFVTTLRAFSPSALVIDLKMPGFDGVQLLQRVRDEGCDAGIILVSGMDQRVLSMAEKLGRSHGLNIVGVLQKPVKLAELQALLRSAASSQQRFTPDELKHAIETGDLIVHYQPKIERNDDRWLVNSAEALVRWRHPTEGLVMPAEFVPLAEEYDLIGPLTDYVLKTCIQQISVWSKRELDCHLAVNLSARSIEDLEFPDRLKRLMDEHDVAGSSLTLELTESAAMADPTKAMDIFLRLRVADLGLAIDDFGTGFSSLKQLYQLPFDELKVDRTFVQDLPGDDEARAIVRATIDMGHALGMRVCAEGVETVGALEYLESVGCDRAQGFLIGRPGSASEFERLVGPWQLSPIAAVHARR
ncbi:MAG TPA: EAL domain-containing response regulator [Gammaproteobacteria bacterium]|nr:EAL domain-containing response regulator [Gammaproteobacteria bacterium]